MGIVYLIILNTFNKNEKPFILFILILV
jgi:hypothetical protein